MTIRLDNEIADRIEKISRESNPHVSKTAVIEYCLERSLEDLET